MTQATSAKTVDSVTNAGNAGSQHAGLRIDSAFEEPRQIIEWLLKRGGRVLITDANYRPVKEVYSGGRIAPIAATQTHGKWRAADAEVRAFIRQSFPNGAVHGVVLWPQGLWRQIYAAIILTVSTETAIRLTSMSNSPDEIYNTL